MAEVAGRRPEMRRAAARSGELRRNALDPAKARRELGWTPATGLSEGLAATIHWLREV